VAERVDADAGEDFESGVGGHGFLEKQLQLLVRGTALAE